MLPLTCCRHALLAAVVLVAAAGPVQAQSDPPGRVARLNYISGQVSLRPASLEDWGVATLNYPLTTGDHLWTERDASAELHVGSSVIRLAPETAFAFLNLDDDVMQVRVAEGTIDVRVREIVGREVYEVDTPNAAISILAPGVYRVDVDPEGDRTRVTVRAGEVEVDGNGRSFSVRPGQMAEIIGIEDAAYDLGRAPSPDRWELWCRDRREDTRVALNYVSRDMVGYEDLDDYGTWSYVPEYGYAWQPTLVAVDWAPYRYGHWAWVRPWGWTWIDHARWGFAPFHYGRWAFHRSHWIWVPGHRMGRPVWAPALVAFVGGHNWRFSFGFGAHPAVGWFPLGPGEFYRPSYRASALYLRNVNVMNVNITNINVTNINVATMRYANRTVAGAMTAVPRDMFVSSQSVNRAGVVVPRHTAEQTPVVGHAVAVTPGAMSVLGHVPAAAARPPAKVMERAVVARTEPPAAATRTAPVVSLSQRARPAGAPPAAPGPQAISPGTANTETAARPRPVEGNARVEAPAVPSRDEANRPNDWRSNRGRNEAVVDRPPAGRADTYAVPRTEQPQPDRSAAPTVRPREAEPSGGWRPSPARPAESPRQVETPRPPQNERAIENAPAPRYERALPRDERPAQRNERPAPTPSYERPTPAGGLREAPAPERSARPRAEGRPAEPARVDRPAAPPAQSARPPERASERPQPQSQSGGRGEARGAAVAPGNPPGGQSQASARPRGRGGDK